MTKGVEILVHVSAPAGTHDDARYRSLAQGCLNFEAERRHDVAVGSAKDEVGAGSKGPRKRPWEDVDTTQDRIPDSRTDTPNNVRYPAASRVRALQRAETTMSPKVQVARTPFFSRSNTAPIGGRGQEVHERHRRSQSDSYDWPRSVVPDSQPSHPSLRAIPPAADTSSQGPSDISSPTALRYEKHATVSVTSSPKEDAPSDEIPSSSQQELRSTPPSTSFKTQKTPLKPSSQVDQTPSNKRQPLSPQDPPSTPAAPPTSSFRVSPASSPPNLNAELEFPDPTPEEVPLPRRRTIRAPVPSANSIEFSTHLTPALLQLSSKPMLASLYRPISTSRTIRIFERGYWRLFITSAWDTTTKEKFWKFLQDFISGGRAGWGVWAEWIGKQEVEDQRYSGSTVGMEEEKAYDVVKVFCWGEVVREVWMVLFIASHRKINDSRAVWVDSGEDVVVRMR